MIVLDTDHISILQHADSEAATALEERLTRLLARTQCEQEQDGTEPRDANVYDKQATVKQVARFAHGLGTAANGFCRQGYLNKIPSHDDGGRIGSAVHQENQRGE